MMPLKNKILSFIVGLTALTSISCKQSGKTQLKPTKINRAFIHEGNLQLNSKGEQKSHEFFIEIADDDYQRATGLMDRQSMKDNQGMLFIFPTERPLNFYMKNTYIGLDLIFANDKAEIIHIHKYAKPLDLSSISSVFPAMYVFEVNAGLTDQLNIEIGDDFSFNYLDEK
ncbi:MAG: hypothetical protein CMC19_01375 [Flavobacteriaceae bacterium]|nr:hypothetical protein [Flavobacteriaceae bacterium]